MKKEIAEGLTRRQLLSRMLATGTLVAIGPGFISAPNTAWALQVNVIQPGTMATLIQMARDIYPHDKVADEFYVTAMKGYDSETKKDMVEKGVSELNGLAKAQGYASYADVGWEKDRVALLQKIEGSAFFQTIRGGLVTGLYNQKAVWPVFGYEGSSFEHGGYVNRGFDDINWL